MKAFISMAILSASFVSTADAQSGGPAYKYSGSHAGGPANDLISNGSPRPVVRPEKNKAYRYSGSHAGGPANDLIQSGKPRPVKRPVVDKAYRYSGPHAGGPANDIPRR